MRPLYLLAALGLLASACSRHLDTSPFVRGRYDRKGERQGRWVVYYDSAQTKLQLRARYRHGRSVGRWQHYSALGFLERREHFHRNIIDITDYHPNGQVWYQGQARLVDEPTALHYYWYGDWVVYTDTGALQKIETYEHGQRVASWSPTAGNLVP